MKCAFTGSFDPITIGHMNIIERATELFDEVDVVILINPDKVMKFSLPDRLAMLKLATARLPCVNVDYYEGMAVDYCNEKSVNCIIRGIRNKSDLEYELKMAQYNRANGKIETLFLMADEGLREVSSTAGVANEAFIPKECREYFAKSQIK